MAGAYGFVSPMNVLLVWPRVINNFELWRVVSCFFYHKVGFPWLMLMVRAHEGPR